MFSKKGGQVMTEEEKKAMELLYGCVIHEKYHIFQKTLRKAIEVVLTLINKQNKTIEYWIKGFERELDKNRENVIEIIEKDNKIEELEKAVDKKDKIIDEMAVLIANLDIDKEICKHQITTFCDDKAQEVSVSICIKCIKEYFKKKEG